MIAEGIECLYEVLGKPEIFVKQQFFWPLEHVGHLQCDRLDQAFGMLCKVPVFG